MTSRQNIKMFDVNGVNVAKHWHVAGEVFAISDCLVVIVIIYSMYLYIAYEIKDDDDNAIKSCCGHPIQSEVIHPFNIAPPPPNIGWIW